RERLDTADRRAVSLARVRVAQARRVGEDARRGVEAVVDAAPDGGGRLLVEAEGGRGALGGGGLRRGARRLVDERAGRRPGRASGRERGEVLGARQDRDRRRCHGGAAQRAKRAEQRAVGGVDRRGGVGGEDGWEEQDTVSAGRSEGDGGGDDNDS